MPKKENINLSQIIISRRRELEEILIRVNKSLRRPPEGSLRIAKKKTGLIYYQRQPGIENIIARTDNPDLIASLAQKAYDQKVQRALKQELSVLKPLAKFYKTPTAEQIYYSLSPERQALVTPYWTTDEAFIKQWESVENPGLMLDLGQKHFRTEKGELVRSKSEKIIADLLYKLKIPYRYEYPLTVGSHTLKPDFTVLNVRTRREFYIEHVGLLDDENYRNSCIQKLKTYNFAGHYIGKDILFTVETQNQSLDVEWIEKILRDNLL